MIQKLLKEKKSRDSRRELCKKLLGDKCVNCGSIDNIEFDHVFPEDMLFRIGSNLNRKLEVLLIELQKCQLLCKKCHIDKTKTETKRLEPAHGTVSEYVNFKCRCNLCKTSWAKYYYNRRLQLKLNKI